jgi:hypothetical protein
MSEMDFQRCNKCDKVLDMTCSCSPENYIIQLPVSDHVSKQALREWCEEIINSMNRSVALHELSAQFFIRTLLEKFCKEGE